MQLAPQVVRLVKLVAVSGHLVHVEEVIGALWPEVAAAGSSQRWSFAVAARERLRRRRLWVLELAAAVASADGRPSPALYGVPPAVANARGCATDAPRDHPSAVGTSASVAMHLVPIARGASRIEASRGRARA